MRCLRLPIMGLILLVSTAGWSQSRRVASQSAEKRWTLSDWLAQKDRSHMMDLWLAFNSPSPYEVMVGGSYISYINKPEAPALEETYSSLSGEFSAYAQIFGVTAEYENNTKENFNDLSGIFNLRLFGNSIQNSYLALNYGIRTRNLGPSDNNTSGHDITLRQQFAQATLQLYLQKHFGIDGYYRQFMPTNTAEFGEVKGKGFEAGVFIDFNRLRIFGRWYQEDFVTVDPATSVDSTLLRSGLKMGLKFYF